MQLKTIQIVVILNLDCFPLLTVFTHHNYIHTFDEYDYHIMNMIESSQQYKTTL